MVARGKSKKRRESNALEAALSKSGKQYSSLPPPPSAAEAVAIPASLRRMMNSKKFLKPKSEAHLALETCDPSIPNLTAPSTKAVVDSSNINQSQSIGESLETESHAEVNQSAAACPEDNLPAASASATGVEASEENKSKKKQKRRDLAVGKLKFSQLSSEGSTAIKKSHLNEKKKQYLKAKKIKNKKLDPFSDPHTTTGPPPVKFGEVVQAPPKFFAKPIAKTGRKSGDGTGSGTKTKLASHWPELMGSSSASKERLRLAAIELYRSKRSGGSRPSAAKLPAGLPGAG